MTIRVRLSDLKVDYGSPPPATGLLRRFVRQDVIQPFEEGMHDPPLDSLPFAVDDPYLVDPLLSADKKVFLHDTGGLIRSEGVKI